MKCKECGKEFNFWAHPPEHVSIRIDWPRQANNPKHVDLCLECYPKYNLKYQRGVK